MEKVGEDKEMVVASYNYSTDHNMPLNYPVDKRFPLGDPSVEALYSTSWSTCVFDRV